MNANYPVYAGQQIISCVTEKATGNQYEYRTKKSWDKLYYSFDNGRSWDKSRLTAFESAKASGVLIPARV